MKKKVMCLIVLMVLLITGCGKTTSKWHNVNEIQNEGYYIVKIDKDICLAQYSKNLYNVSASYFKNNKNQAGFYITKTISFKDYEDSYYYKVIEPSEYKDIDNQLFGNSDPVQNKSYLLKMKDGIIKEALRQDDKWRQEVVDTTASDLEEINADDVESWQEFDRT